MSKIIKNTMNLKMNKEKESAIFLLSFLLPFIMMLAILISKNVFPFGDRCILRTDFYHQYLPFYSELQHKLQNFKSLFYTYDVGLGTNFITIIAYYLSCPLNILLFFVPENYVLEYMTIMIVIKIALATLTMSYYLVKRYKTDSFIVLFFSIFYAMGGYICAYYWNIMWLNNILLFPLLMLGFENIQNGKKPYLYIITLSLSILFNYYIGAITCIFLIVYFIFYNILKNYKLKMVFKNFVKTGLYSIVGVLISCVLLVPVFFAFKTTASSESTFPTTFREYFTIVEVIARHFPFVKIENGIEYWPNLYSGIAVLPLLIMYFISKKYKIKEKICYAIIILFFIASFSINVLDYVWHVFKYPNSLPCRQSFIYTFLILIISIKPLLKLKSIKDTQVTYSFALTIILIIVIQKLVENEKVKFYSIYYTMLFLIVYLILFLKAISKKTNVTKLLYVTIVFVCFEAFMNMHQTSISTIKRDDYMKNVDSIKKLTHNLKGVTDDFYRVERAEMKTKDDGAFMHFPSSSIFSSSSYAAGSDFYKKLGMEASTNAYSITGSTPFTDSLLAVNYKIYEKEEPNFASLNMRKIMNDEEVYMYQNIDTLPLSFVLTDDFLEDFDMSSGNPATNINNFSRSLKLGVMLDKKPVEISGTTAKIKITDDGDYYAFVRDKGIKEVTVSFDTTSKKYSNLNRGYFIELGFLKADTSIEFRNETNDDELLIEVFKFNYDTLRKVNGTILSHADFDMKKFDETHISYNLDVKKEGKCILTLPFDKGFTVKVDGVSIEPEPILDLFLGFSVEKGNHSIEISYMPEGFVLGVMLSILGFISLIAIYIYNKNIHKVHIR